MEMDYEDEKYFYDHFFRNLIDNIFRFFFRGFRKREISTELF